MTSMRPSAVRTRISTEHADLRKDLDGLEKLAEQLEGGDASVVSEALRAAAGFYTKLRDHIDLEDAILAPALREADAWGDLRADQLIEHHREQRRQLDVLTEETGPEVAPQHLANLIRAIVAEVREDMAHEDKALLNPNLLRDDVIGIDTFGG